MTKDSTVTQRHHCRNTHLVELELLDVGEEGRQVLLAHHLHGRAQRAVRRFAHFRCRVIYCLRTRKDFNVSIILSYVPTASSLPFLQGTWQVFMFVTDGNAEMLDEHAVGRLP